MKGNFDKYFILLAVTELVFTVYYPQGRIGTKPLIMISLIYYFWTSSQSRDSLFLIALFFALIGDVVLMFDNLFLVGLGSFLIMQLLYAICFIQHRGPRSIRKLFLTIIVIAVTIGLQMILLPHVGELLIPVVAYSAVIGAMVLAGIWRTEKGQHYIWILVGVLLFMISDSLLAINKFAFEIPFGGFWVMLTYIAAQYLIVKGFLKYERADLATLQVSKP